MTRHFKLQRANFFSKPQTMFCKCVLLPYIIRQPRLNDSWLNLMYARAQQATHLVILMNTANGGFSSPFEIPLYSKGRKAVSEYTGSNSESASFLSLWQAEGEWWLFTARIFFFHDLHSSFQNLTWCICVPFRYRSVKIKRIKFTVLNRHNIRVDL